MERSVENILYDLQSDFEKYKSLTKPLFNKLIEEEGKEYKRHFDALSDLYFFQNYLLDFFFANFNRPANRTVSIIYTKAAGDIYALRECLIAGQLIASSTIERTIFENYINARLIFESDTEYRCKLYEEYQYILLYERVKTFQEYIKKLENTEPADSPVLSYEKKYFNDLYKDTHLEQIKDRYDQVRSNYHDKYPHNWYWKIFSHELGRKGKLTLKYVCEKLNIYNDYLHIYSTASLAVHNQPLSANLMTLDQKVTSTPIYSPTTTAIAGLAASLVIEIIVMVLKYCECNQKDEIELFLNHNYKDNFIE